MVKKVTAPKTYDPGRGRPKEHLAYLNEREMDYLRSINGNNMERGPRGLPSFPPDDSIGSSSRASSSKGGGSKGPGGPSGPNSSPSGSRGAGGGSKGPGGPSGPNSRSSASSSTSQAKTSTTSGYKGPSSPMGGQRSSFSSPSSASSYNKDVGMKNALSSKGAINTVKNTPALKNDGVTGFKAQALGVKPVGGVSLPKQSQPAPAKVGPANRDMEVNRNLDRITADFYNTDPTYQKALANERAKVAQSRASVGLMGAGISPRDALSAPARTAPSTGMTQGEWNALKDKYNPVSVGSRLAGGIADLAGQVYNDPVGTANRAIDSFGQYAKNAYNTIGAAATSSDPDVLRAAAEKAAEIGLNYGLMGSAGSIAGGVPANSVGMFVSPRASPKLYDVAKQAEDLKKRGATPEDVFRETARRTDYGVSGWQQVETPRGIFSGFEVSAPMEVRKSFAEAVEPSVAGRLRDATFGKLVGDNARLRDVVDTTPLDDLYGGAISDIRVTQMSRPSQVGYYNPTATLGQYSPYDKSIGINIPATRGALPMLGERSAENFSPVIVHEAQHVVSDLDKRTGYNKIPQGTNSRAEAAKIRDRLERYGLSMPEKQVRDLAVDAYWKNPGEIAAQLGEKRRLNSPESMKSFESRFAAEPEWERAFRHQARVDAIIRDLDEKRRGWASAWDTVRLD